MSSTIEAIFSDKNLSFNLATNQGLSTLRIIFLLSTTKDDDEEKVNQFWSEKITSVTHKRIKNGFLDQESNFKTLIKICQKFKSWPDSLVNPQGRRRADKPGAQWWSLDRVARVAKLAPVE